MLKRSRGQKAYFRERKRLIKACTEWLAKETLAVEGELDTRLVMEAEVVAGDTILGVEARGCG